MCINYPYHDFPLCAHLGTTVFTASELVYNQLRNLTFYLIFNISLYLTQYRVLLHVTINILNQRCDLYSRGNRQFFFILQNGDWRKSEKRPNRFATTCIKIAEWLCLEIRETDRDHYLQNQRDNHQRTTQKVMPPTQFSCGTQGHVYNQCLRIFYRLADLCLHTLPSKLHDNGTLFSLQNDTSYPVYFLLV